MNDGASNAITRLVEKAAAPWRRNLIVSGKGNPRPLLANALTALREAPEWQGVFRFDEFALRIEAAKQPPWAQGSNAEWTARPWCDADDIQAADWMQHQGIAVTPHSSADAIEAAARAHPFHPVREYLRSLKWDGTPRAESLASRYFGAANTLYHCAVGSRFLIAAVARIYQPGCKADCMPIFEGPQGTLKSTALRALAGDSWFTDEISELGSKDASMQLSGVWLIEIAELGSMKRPEIERVKAFLSRRVDRFRPAYGRRVIAMPRQCVFAGTTNSDAYLKDETGARRFWPVKCGRIDVGAIVRDRDQLWAEAHAQFKAGKAWWLDTPELINAAAEEQEARHETDAWESCILSYLAGYTETSVEEILRAAIGRPRDQWGQTEQNRVARVLKRSGWDRYQKRTGTERRWLYRRPTSQSEPGP